MTSRDIWKELGTSLETDEADMVNLLNERDSQKQELVQTTTERDAAKAEVVRLQSIIDSMKPEPAKPRIGVASHECTYFQAGDVYNDMPKCEAAADLLDLDFMRDLLQMGNDAYWQRTKGVMQRHFAHGRTHELTVGRWADIGSYDWALAKARLVEAAKAGWLSGVAGINEPDDSNNGGEGYSLAKYADHQQRLFAMVKSTPELQNLPVACGAIRGANADWDNATIAQIKACKPYMDEFNFHWYPLSKSQNATEQQVRDAFAHKISVVRSVWSGPIYISEAGASAYNVSEARQGWVDMIILDLCQEAGVKVVVYELIRDAAKTVQSWFGVVNYDGTPTLAGSAIAGTYAKRNR